MKKQFHSGYITRILFLGAMLVIIGSCKKYLEVTPVSSFGTDYVFSNVTNAEKAVLGAYSALGGDQGYGIRISMYYPYDNDEMMGQGGTPFPDNERRDIAHFNVQPSNTQLAGPFNQLYRGIERANICIYNIPLMEMYSNGNENEQRELRRLHGEALTLRAQYFFELIRNWGDIPAQFTPSSFEEDLFKAKMDRDTIYNRILTDLQTAAGLIPWRNQLNGVTSERITQGAVRALRARIALFAGGYSLRQDRTMKRPADYRRFYEIARDECLAVMQSGAHSMNSSFLSLFRDYVGAHVQDPTWEIIWEVGMTGGSSNFGDSKLGYYNGPRYNNTGNSALTILPTYFYSFDPEDTRRDVMCAPYDINASGNLVARPLQTMVDGKFRRDWTNQMTSPAQYFGTNWPVIRYSDVLLMYAEAQNELNGVPDASAISALEQVRTRGFGGDQSKIGSTPSDYEGFFQAVMNERSLELGGEGIRKYDLIRWNLLGQRLAETKAALAAMAARQAPYDNLPIIMYYTPNQPTLQWLNPNSFYGPAPASAPAGSASVAWITANGINNTILRFYAVAFEANKNELLPIPQASIDANPRLVQHYGY